ncbi:unnamed protein product, partial [Heterosigma akashiwo]
MDLGTIEKKLKAGTYPSPAELLTDIRLVFHNCQVYNRKGSALWRAAERMSHILE